MDKHLSILAKQHIETRFVKINAEKAPYLAEKLRIVVLPTLALIKNAKVDNYLVCLCSKQLNFLLFALCHYLKIVFLAMNWIF